MKRYYVCLVLFAVFFGFVIPASQGLDTPGTNVIWFMNANQVTSSTATHFYADLTHWDVIASCDLDGDGTADLIWWNDETGQTVPWMMNSDGSLRDGSRMITIEPQWKLKACADINGDGKADMLWRYTLTH